MRYLTAEGILAIHERILEESGGLAGIRDIGLLYSIVEKPKASFGGQEMYQGIFVKGAAMLEALVNYHVFFDANKRTAFVTTAIYLRMQGYELEVTEAHCLQFMIAVAKKKKTLVQIARWLEVRCVKVQH